MASKAKPRRVWLRDGSSATDLFGDVIVTQGDISAFVQNLPHAPAPGWRLEHYIKAYDIAGKVRAMKALGEWPISTA